MSKRKSDWKDDSHEVSIISTVAEFLQITDGLSGPLDTEYLYRGQADVQWRVDCSAVRRLALDPTVNPTLIGHTLVAYMATLLDGASFYVGTCPELPQGCSELEVLAQLQHQGAATGLIDFSTNPLVALWFACSGHPTSDGAVYGLSRSDIRSTNENDARYRVVDYFYGAGSFDVPYVWCPGALSGRPASQESVFVLGVPFLWPSLLRRVVIDKKVKTILLDELRAEHGISEDILFADFTGFAHANSVPRPFDIEHVMQFWTERVSSFREESPERAQAYVDCGLVYVEAGRHEQAIEQFTKAVTEDSDNVGAYVNRAGAKLCIDNFFGALSDYNVAIEKFEKTDGVDIEKVARVYWDRGRTLMKIGQNEQGYADCNRALKMGLKMFYNGTGIVDRIEKMLDYQS